MRGERSREAGRPSAFVIDYMKLVKQKNKWGFTLIEVIVALGIFSIATSYAISIFVQSNQVQKRTANMQRILSDARYALEVMAREVRMGHIDYDYYAGQDISLDNMPLTQDNAVLAIKDASNQEIRFRRQEAEEGRYVIQVYNQGDWLDITPEDLSVERLSFYISPSADPFVWNSNLVDYNSDQQPIVTIVLETKSLYRDLDTEKVSHLQTTVAERKYVR